MIVGAVCMSHSPLMGTALEDRDTQAGFDSAVAKAARFVAEQEPDLVVMFFPDHVNGFFYRMLPPFAVIAEGESIGDWGTTAGRLNIPSDLAAACHGALLGAGVDAAISWKGEVDHGATQPLELMAAAWPMPPVVPVFLNCALAPRPGFARVRALGQAVHDWAAGLDRRVLMMASGGLSHDPPIPALEGAPPEVRKRLVEGGALTHAQRVARQQRVIEEGRKSRDGTSTLTPLNPDWDRALLDALAQGRLDLFDTADEAEMTAIGGRGGHEVRSWFAALAALGPDYRAEELFYAPIDPWLTGMGIMIARPGG